ncbi:uncharacterized protein LOC117626982 isoform X1 [Prunus dulcis]|uniref:uncharacterized protein LOC117626982 isoform X1 n=1 Tax=Prunus dulcis TaxID=3755 RepID=UPI00148326EE|nr:uncharacterized protein LOC117626982 isoform X1 [Prunus dulcis]
MDCWWSLKSRFYTNKDDIEIKWPRCMQRYTSKEIAWVSDKILASPSKSRRDPILVSKIRTGISFLLCNKFKLVLSNLMVMKPGQVQLLSVLKACQSYVGSNISNLTRMAAPTTLVGSPELKQPVTSSPPPPQLQLLYQLASVPSTTKDNYRSFGNPCRAIYFNYKTHRHLKQLLPLAWSHNPLTTLKLICSLLRFKERELFYTAASWLFQNHPKTLACNVVPIAGHWGISKTFWRFSMGF